MRLKRFAQYRLSSAKARRGAREACPRTATGARWWADAAGEHGAGIAQGDYSGCFAVGTLPEVRAALEPAFLDDEGPSDDLPTRITLPKS